MEWGAQHNAALTWRVTKHIHIVKVLRSPAIKMAKNLNKHWGPLFLWLIKHCFVTLKKESLLSIQPQNDLCLSVHKYSFHTYLVPVSTTGTEMLMVNERDTVPTLKDLASVMEDRHQRHTYNLCIQLQL